MSEHSILFTNSFTIPVQLETWQSSCYGLSSLVSKLVDCGETIEMKSDTGEWFVNNFIMDKDIMNQWKNTKYEFGINFCKFRDEPCIKGNYSWKYEDDFELILVLPRKLYIFKKKNN